MKVVCNDVGSFIENLKGDGKLFQDTVWVDISRNEVSEVVDHVSFQASALIQLPDESEYMLQLGIDCGKDYNDSSDEHNGTVDAVHFREILESYCKRTGLTVKPGIISE